MKKGNEIYQLIKCEAKEGTEQLKQLHMAANQILYNHNFSYITFTEGQDMVKKLIANGKQLKELEVNEKAIAKKKEIILKLATVIRALQSYLQEEDTPEQTQKQLQATINYAVAQYIREKEMTVETALKWLNRQKEIFKAIEWYEDKMNITVNQKAFAKMNTELLGIIMNEYKLY